MLGFVIVTTLLAAQPSGLEPVFIEDRGVEMMVRRRFYGVEGRRFAAARNSVFARQIGYQWAAGTSYHVSAEWHLEPTEDECRISSVFLSSEVTIELPHWVDFERASGRSKRQWRELSEGIQVHEHGHVNIAFYGITRARDILEALPPRPDCDALATDARAALEDASEWIARNQREYDRLSSHGEEQDAVADWFPHDDAVGRLPE